MDSNSCIRELAIAQRFHGVVTRQVNSKNHVVKSKFKKNFTLTHQRAREVLIHLQEDVAKEIEKLIKEHHIGKLDQCSEQFFISPIVIIMKRDKSIKFARESKMFNKAVHKNKYQMPNLGCLLDSITQQNSSPNTEGPAWFSTLDLKYA